MRNYKDWRFSQMERRIQLSTHPIFGIKCRAAMGYSVPPMDDPVDVIPTANPLRLLNQWPTTPMVGPKVAPAPI